MSLINTGSFPKMSPFSTLLSTIVIITVVVGESLKPETLVKVLRRKQSLLVETDLGNGSPVGSEVEIEVTNLETSKKWSKKWPGHTGIYEITDLTADTWYGLQFKSVTKQPSEFAYSQYKLARTLPDLEDLSQSSPDEEFPLKVSLVVYSDGVRAMAASPYTKYFDIISVLTTFCRGGVNHTQRLSLSVEQPENSALVVNGSNFATADVVSRANSSHQWLEILPSQLDCSKVCWNTWVVSRNYHESFQQPTQCQMLKADRNRVVFLPQLEKIDVDDDQVDLQLSDVPIGDRDETKVEVQLTDLQTSDVLPIRTFLPSNGLNFSITNLHPGRHYALQYQPKLLSPAYNGSISYRMFRTADVNDSTNVTANDSTKLTVNISQTRDFEKILVHISSLLEGFDINFTAYLSCDDNTTVSAVITPFNPAISLSFNISSLKNVTDSDDVDMGTTGGVDNVTMATTNQPNNGSEENSTADDSDLTTTVVSPKESQNGCRQVCWKAAVILKQPGNTNRPVGSDCFQIDMSQLSLDSKSSGKTADSGLALLIGTVFIWHILQPP